MAVSSQTGVGIALGGIGMLIFGIFLMTVCTPMMFGICIPVYAGPGMLLIVLGIVVMILGFVLPYATAPSPPQYYAPVGYAPMGYGYAPYGAQPGYGAYPAYGAPPQAGYYQPQQPAQTRACVRCGAAVSSQICGSCGTQQW